MRYKGFKQMKCAAAVILSAAIVLTDVSGVFAAEYEQTLETEVVEETTQSLAKEDTVAEDVAVESGTLQESVEISDEIAETQPEISHTEEDTKINTDAGQTASDFSGETEFVETETTEVTDMETGEISTEVPEKETTDIQIPIPEVDDSIYALEKKDHSDTNNAASFASYNAQGTLTQNEQGEYVIENRDQFFIFLSSSIDYSGSKVILNCDVDMKGETAQLVRTFEGELNGNGHSIYNYKSGGGLFKQIGADGSIRKLHLSGITYADDAPAVALATTNNGSLSEITVNADIKVTKSMTAAAGIVRVNSGTMSNCAFAGNITAAESGPENLEDKAIGGIVSENKGTINKCHALGYISTNTSVSGGIAAENSGKIEDSTNHMSITGACYVGGIAADNTGSVSKCRNYGAVSQKDVSTEGLAGGIAGTSTGSISDCENYADVSGEYKNIGGIAGNSTGTVTGCGNYGAVTGSENVGGIVGLFSGSGSTIKSSFNKGNISAKFNENSNMHGIGGILGAASRNADTDILDCYNTGALSGASKTTYLGGIVGMLYKGRIENTYNIGEISTTATNSFNPCAGMIAGFLGKEPDASYNNCLFAGGSDTVCYREDNERASASEVIATTEKVTSEVLKSSNSALGSGFASDENGINGGYPIIKEQKAKISKYIIMYEPNGGCADYYFTETENSVSAPSASPYKKSAKFLAWYKDKEHKTEYSFGSVTKSEIIYAGWEIRPEVEDINLDQTDVTLIVNESFDIKPQVLFTPENAENKNLTFSSNNSSVATVDENGIIKAVGVGTAEISIKLADGSLDKQLIFTVDVSNAENIVRFKLYNDASAAEITRATISVGEPVVIQAVFGAETPEDATLEWSSSNPAYVKKTERTNLINIKAVELEGLKPTPNGTKIEITCILKYPDGTYFTGTLYVTVRPLAESVSISLGKEDATGKDVVYDIDTKKFIAIGTNKLTEPVEELSASILPKAADQRIKWSSSDPAVIRFNDEESGKVVGNKGGEATITATPYVLYGKGADGKEVKGTVRVKTRRIIQSLSFTPKSTDKNGVISYDSYGRIEITDGMSIKLEPTYSPVDATIKKVSWKNSNPDALNFDKIDEGTNVATVKAKKVAANTVVKLTAEATDMGGASCELVFIVKPKVEKINIYRKDDIHQDNCLSGGSVGVEDNESIVELVAVNEPDNALQKVTWKISNTKVADLTPNDDGSCTLKIKEKGTAQITATAADGTGIKAVTTLNVTSLAKRIEIEGSKTVMVGGKIKLTATAYPKSANNPGIKWESVTPEYATVDEKTGEVTGRVAGTAIIKATAQDGSGVTARHPMTVYAVPEEFDIMVPDNDKDEKNDKLLTGKTIGIDPDTTTEYEAKYTVAARILPKEACQEVEWKSSNEKVATVKNGEITAHALGKATITASSIDGSNKQASITVNVATLVTSIEITGSHYVGYSDDKNIALQLKAVVGNKDATNKSVVWKSEYPSIAEVDEKGLVMANAKTGSTKITAEAVDGSGVIAEHMVYVVSSKNKVTISREDSGIGDWSVDKNDNRSITGIDLADRETMTIRLRADLSGGSTGNKEVPMELKWSTSNKNIATVEADERDSHFCTVTLYNKGVSGKKTVQITATTTEGYATSGSVSIKDIENTNPWVTITGTGHRLANGKKMQLSAGNIAVKWYSDNESIAKVDEKKGVVTADKSATGTVKITAVPVVGKGNPNWDTYEINVMDPVSSVDVTLNGYKVTNEKIGVDLMKDYKELKLGALLDEVASEEVTWKSSSSAIATLDEDGYLDLKKAGTVTFTATATDGSRKKGKVTFIVAKQVTQMWPAGDKKNVVVGLKKSVQLNVEYRPFGTTIKKATWVSSAPEIVSVNKNTGKVTGKDIGTAVITATATDGSGKSCEFIVNVEPAVSKVEIVSARLGEYSDVVGVDLSSDAKVYTENLSVNLYEYDKENKDYFQIADQDVTWSSSNKAIAEVDENGNVTVHKAGTVTIKATATDGSKKTGKIKLYAGKLVTKINLDPSLSGGIDLYLDDKNYRTYDLANKVSVDPLTASNKTLVFTSTNKKFVTVNSKGKVTAKKVNDEPVSIIITTKDGSGVREEIRVDVN